MKTAVLDTNIVASASFWSGPPRRCLEAWAKGEFMAFVSPPLLAEYAEVTERLALRYPDRKLTPWAEALEGAAELIFPAIRLSGVASDPDDDMLLECAVSAEAEFLVTGDKAHLLSLGEVRGVRIVSASDFLAELNR
jgi:uncharacterized protein